MVERANAAQEKATTPAGVAGLGGAGQPVLCDSCPHPARVRILEAYQQGCPVFRHYCLHCTPRTTLPQPLVSQPARRPRLTIAALVGLSGVVIGTLAVFGETVLPTFNTGFGRHQWAGVLLGGLMTFIGTLLRVDVVALGGLLIFGMALSADFFSRMPGFGWKQQALLSLSLGCVMFALFSRPLAPFLQRVWLRVRTRWG